VLTEADDPLCLDDEAAAASLRGAPWRRVAVLGDSIAAGAGDPVPGYRTAYWADRVGDALRATAGDITWLSTGRTGATTRHVIDEQLEAIEQYRPDLALLACGGNDLWPPQPDYAQIGRNLDEIIGRLTRGGAIVLTMTIADAIVDPRMSAMRPRLERLNSLIRHAASGTERSSWTSGSTPYGSARTSCPPTPSTSPSPGTPPSPQRSSGHCRPIAPHPSPSTRQPGGLTHQQHRIDQAEPGRLTCAPVGTAPAGGPPTAGSRCAGVLGGRQPTAPLSLRSMIASQS
jgi:lysophospholipase L1-like esterase